MLRYKFEKKDYCLRGHPRTPENVSPGRYCKLCRAIWNKEHPSTSEKKNKARSNKLGWNKKLYLTTRKQQKNRCAICRRRFRYTPDSNSNACRDHKHGRVPKPRGLLCHCCNLLLGNSRESIKIMKAAIKYLIKWDKMFA